MGKTQIELSNTECDNVIKFLEHRLRSGEGKSLARTRKCSTYPDGIVRELTYQNELERPYRNGYKLIVKDSYGVLVSPGTADPKHEGFRPISRSDGLVFTGFQLQTNTVLLEIEYLDHWQDLVTKILSELSEKFPNNRTETPIIAAQENPPRKYSRTQQKHKFHWQRIRDDAYNGVSPSVLIKRYKLPYKDEETVRKIIEEGQSGLLDI